MNDLYICIGLILALLISIEFICRCNHYLKWPGLSISTQIKYIFLGKWLLNEANIKHLYIKEVSDATNLNIDDCIYAFSEASGKTPDKIRQIFLNKNALLEDYRYDPLIGFRPLPNQKYKHLTLNSNGLRGQSRTGLKQKNVKRVILLGGSVAYGRSATCEENTIAQKLQKYLNESDNEYKWEVINCALPSFISYQELLILINEGVKYQPDYVISFSGINDASAYIDSGTLNMYSMQDKITTAYGSYSGKFWHRTLLYLSTIFVAASYFKLVLNRIQNRSQNEGEISPFIYTLW